jgi:hypothetical protein
MTAYENPVLMLFAFGALAAVFFIVLKYYKPISISLAVLVSGGLALFGVLYVAAVVGAELYERHVTTQCLTAHERTARARAAPNDYWGQQLRDASMEEAKKCADLAARKEAARVSQK